MERRQNGGRRRQIIQQFVLNITDDTERLICFFYMNNYQDRFILRQLRLNKPRLEAIKLKLAIDLRKAGIRDMGE